MTFVFKNIFNEIQNFNPIDYFPWVMESIRACLIGNSKSSKF